jgi:hypothetical protein
MADLSGRKIAEYARRTSSTPEDPRSDAYGYTSAGGSEMQNPKDKSRPVQDIELLVRVRAPGDTPEEAMQNVVGALVDRGVELAGPVEWSEADAPCEEHRLLHELARVIGPAGILTGPYDPDTWN